MGGKADQFILKARAAAESGFLNPATFVLAEDFLDGIIFRNFGRHIKDLEQDEGIPEKILGSTFSMSERAVLEGSRNFFGIHPLLLRSSGPGDAWGIGMYNSSTAFNNPRSVQQAFLKTLASFFTPDAFSFRQDAGVKTGFGIMIQPLVANWIRIFLTPILSGIAMTSDNGEEGYIRLVPGLGGGVSTEDGEQITRSQLASDLYGGNLGAYILERSGYMGSVRIEEGQGIERSALLRTNGTIIDDIPEHGFYCTVFDPRSFKGIARNMFVWGEQHVASLYQLNLLPLFDRLEKLRQILGRDQYIEWALTLEKGQPVYWCLQLSDVDAQRDLVDFGDLNTAILQAGNNVRIGTKGGKIDRVCQGAFFLFGNEDVQRLRDFNQDHEGYILIASAKAVFRGSHGKPLPYSYFNRAAGVLEIADAYHESTVPHFEGLIKAVGKFYAVISPKSPQSARWVEIMGDMKNKKFAGRLTVCQDSFRVLGSRFQKQLAVFSI